MEKYGTFYQKNKDKLFGYLMRLTGDYQLSGDIMQESFTRILAHYGSKSQNISLLFTIARNAVLDHIRRKENSKEEWGEPEDKTIDPEQQVLVREKYKKVLGALQRLEKEERDILALVVSSELRYRDIAVISGISEASVKVKVHRARTKLRKILKMGEK